MKDLYGFPPSHMTRTLIPARTQATASVVALLATLTLAASASPADADVEIPLDGAISPQYHVADVAPAADVAVPAAPVVPAPAAEPAPAPVEAPPTEPQYHPEIASGNSEDVSENAAPPTPDEPAPPDEPAAPVDVPDEPAAAPAPIEPPVDLSGAPELESAALDLESLAPDVEAPTPDVDDAIPEADAVVPEVDAPAPVSAGNVNVSIRIFSPGDNGPVEQTGGGGSGTISAPGPTTWIWNWTWTSAPTCDPGIGGNLAPPVGDWTWNWTWTCSGVDAPVSLPDVGELPGIGKPGIDALPVIDTGFGRLAPIVSIPALVPAPDMTAIGPLPIAAASPARDDDEDAAARSERMTGSDLLDPGASVPPSGAPALATFAAPAAAEPAPDRAGARRRGRDTTRPPGAISAHQAPIGAPIAAAAATAAAAGAGASPALLATLIFVLISFLAGTLLDVAGLPRLLLRAARLERPG